MSIEEHLFLCTSSVGLDQTQILIQASVALRLCSCFGSFNSHCLFLISSSLDASFNPFKPSVPKRDIGKQCRPRSDAAERGVWSGSTMFALRSEISTKHDNNNNWPDTSYIGNGLVQWLEVEESTRHKWVKLCCVSLTYIFLHYFTPGPLWNGLLLRERICSLGGTIFITGQQLILTTSQLTHNVTTTSLQRRDVAATLKRRCGDVECLLGLYPPSYISLK